jgi:transposase
MARPTSDFQLEEEDRIYLQKFLQSPGRKKREYKRARVLLTLDQGRSVREVATLTEFSEPTVYRLRSLYHQKGLHSTLEDQPRTGRPQQLSSTERQKIAQLAQEVPPGSRKKWTLLSLAEQAAKRGLISKGSISHTEVARILREEDIHI